MSMKMEFKINEIKYKPDRCVEILAKGIIRDYEFAIISIGTHPCAYVKTPDYFKGIDYNDIPIKCHGGLTYSGMLSKSTKLKEFEGHWIGWDYAHYNDYAGYYDSTELKKSKKLNRNYKKWTTDEIIKEVDEFIWDFEEVVKFANKIRSEVFNK